MSLGAFSALAVEALGEHLDPAALAGAGDASRHRVLAGDQAALAIAGVAVGVVGRTAKDGEAAVLLAVLHDPVVRDVADEHVAAIGEIHRALGPAHPGRHLLDRAAVDAVAWRSSGRGSAPPGPGSAGSACSRTTARRPRRSSRPAPCPPPSPGSRAGNSCCRLAWGLPCRWMSRPLVRGLPECAQCSADGAIDPSVRQLSPAPACSAGGCAARAAASRRPARARWSSRSWARCVFGNAITSRSDSAPVISMTKRSRPMAMPPCGGAPYCSASSRKPNLARASSASILSARKTLLCTSSRWIRTEPPPSSRPFRTTS